MNREKFVLLPEETYAQEMERVNELRAAVARQGTLTVSRDGCRLSYDLWENPNAEASIVLVHGFTEFAEKYRELASVFWACGYRVLLYDQRGHGFSENPGGDPDVIHAESMGDYAEDLKEMIDRVLLPGGKDLPVDLFAHSMGGAAAVWYLEKYPGTVRKCVLSSPMVCPYSLNVPRAFAKASTRVFCRREGGGTRFRYAGTFDPNATFDKSCDGSAARFSYWLALRRATPEYQRAACSNRWSFASLTVCETILKRKLAKRVTAQVLLLSAGKDTLVRTEYHAKLAGRLPDCRVEKFPEAKHAIYSGPEKVREAFCRSVGDFLLG